MTSISIRNFSFSYGQIPILKNINISFEEGKIHTIIGPNGSGKTTLLKNILRLYSVGENQIFIGEKDLLHVKPKTLCKEIAYVPQYTDGEIDFSVKEIVAMGRHPFQGRFEIESTQDAIKIKESLEATNLWELRNKRFSEISGGERQRAVIARALAQSPKIIVMDEPLSNLDIYHQVEIIKLFHTLKVKQGLTVLLVLHDINIALQYSDKLLLLKKGEVVDVGSSKEILNRKSLEKVYGIDFNYVTVNSSKIDYLVPKLELIQEKG